MKFNLKCLRWLTGTFIFGSALVLGLNIAANAQSHDRRARSDTRETQRWDRDSFRRDRHDNRQGYINNGGYDRGSRHGTNGYPNSYNNNGYYNNGRYYDPYYRQPSYNRRDSRYYTPHVDSRNGFRRAIHHALGGH